MKYLSTRGLSPVASFSEVMLGGLAPDGGLYIPENNSPLTIDDINSLRNLSYEELTTKLLFPFVSDELDRKQFSLVVEDAYKSFENQVIDLVEIEENRWVLELFHGPTLAFKDIAMQLLGALLQFTSQKRDTKIAVLGATSGDTGSAAISACSRHSDVDVFILYPHGKVTDIQRKQMTTSGSKNVHALAVEGDFDDCQFLVKQLFLDDEILNNPTKFIAANSINWVRCMTQSVYYFWTFLKLEELKKELTFSIPSGNFGHAYAGWFAKKRNLPIKKLFIATNSNDVLHRLFLKNEYSKGEVKSTIAPSMDISIASNFERLLYDLNKGKSEKVRSMMENFPISSISLSNEQRKISQDFFNSIPSSDAEILEEISRNLSNNNYLIDTHTATATRAANIIGDPSEPVVSMATAHPVKFRDALIDLIPKKEVPVPSQIEDILDKPEDFRIIKNDIDDIKSYIMSNMT